MHIEQLHGENIFGFTEATIDLEGTGVVNLICGPNGGGKTSTGQLPDYVLTGLTRDLEKKQDAKFLARNLESGAKARATIDGKTITRTPSSCSETETALREAYGRPEMISAVLNACRLIELKPEERRKLIKDIKVDPALITGAVVELIRTCADEDMISPDEAVELGQLAATDLKKAEAQAVENRRKANRELDQCLELPSQKATVGGKEWDLEKADLDGMRERLKALEAERDEALKAQGAAEASDSPKALKERIEEIDSYLFENPAVDAGRMRELRKAKEKAADDVEFQRKALATAEAFKRNCTERHEALSKLTGKAACPMCEQKLDEKALGKARKKVYDEGNSAFLQTQECQKKLEEAEAGLKRAALCVFVAADSIRKENELTEEAAALKKRLPDAANAANAAEKLSELAGRIKIGSELISKKEAYDAAKGMQDERAAIEAAWQAWDAIAKGLGKDGPIRKLAAAGFDPSYALESAERLLPGRTIEVRDDWEILVDGIPAKIILSESERLRLGACFAAALAIASGVRVLFVDRLDCLEEDLRPVMLDWLGDVAGDLDTTIAATRTTRETAAKMPCDWLNVYWVEAGGASQLGQSSSEEAA